VLERVAAVGGDFFHYELGLDATLLYTPRLERQVSKLKPIPSQSF
jgi:hypothetical protein